GKCYCHEVFTDCVEFERTSLPLVQIACPHSVAEGNAPIIHLLSPSQPCRVSHGRGIDGVFPLSEGRLKLVVICNHRRKLLITLGVFRRRERLDVRELTRRDRWVVRRNLRRMNRGLGDLRVGGRQLNLKRFHRKLQSKGLMLLGHPLQLRDDLLRGIQRGLRPSRLMRALRHRYLPVMASLTLEAPRAGDDRNSPGEPTAPFLLPQRRVELYFRKIEFCCNPSQSPASKRPITTN